MMSVMSPITNALLLTLFDTKRSCPIASFFIHTHDAVQGLCKAHANNLAKHLHTLRSVKVLYAGLYTSAVKCIPDVKDRNVFIRRNHISCHSLMFI